MGDLHYENIATWGFKRGFRSTWARHLLGTGALTEGAQY